MAFNKNRVVETARKYVEKGQLDKAVKEYLRVVREDPKDVRVWLKIGDLYAKKGARAEAIETYLKVAKFYSEQGFDLKAVAVYKQILKIDPRLIEVNLKLAELYRQMGLMKEAMEQFETVASHFHREGKTKEALATVRQLVDLDPDNVATRIKLAELYSKEGMATEAITEFAKAGEQLRASNRPDDFIKVAERLLWHKPDNLDLSRELASLYLQRNDPRRALYKLQACFKANSRDIETLALLAQVFQALEQKPKTIQVLKELARVLEEDGNRERAKDVHHKILHLAPADPDSLAYVESGRASQPSVRPSSVQQLAMTGQDMAQRRSPNPTGSMPLVDPRLIPGVQFGDDGSISVVDEDSVSEVDEDLTSELIEEDEYDSSVQGEVYSDEIAKILTDADVYVRYGLHQKAIEHLRRIFDLDPDNIEAHEQLKGILLDQGREKEAIAELMRLAELTAGRDPDQAEAYLRELLSIDGTYRPAFDLAGRYLLNLASTHDIEVVDSYDGRAHADGGRVALIDDVLDFDDVEISEDDIDMPSGGRPPSASESLYEFELDSQSDVYGSGEPSSVTMELDVDEVDAIIDRVDGGDWRPGFGPAQVRTVPASTMPYSQSVASSSQYDWQDGGAYGGDAGFDPLAGLDEFGDEPVFDPEDAARFDAERAKVARQLDVRAKGSQFDVPTYDGPPRRPGDSAPQRSVDVGGYHDSNYHDSPAAATIQMDSSIFDEYPAVEHPDRRGGAGAKNGFPLVRTQRQDQPIYNDPRSGGNFATHRNQEFTSETVDTGIDVLEEKIIQQPVEQTANGIEDDLDEADFFVSQRLYDEARGIIGGLLAIYPEHPLLVAKLHEIDDLQNAAVAASRETYVPISKLDDKSLQRLEPHLIGDSALGKQPSIQLENPVADEDAETHFDLGLAYKEMGLYDDAVKAFKKVLAKADREVQCRVMIGLCLREQGNLPEAIHQFKAGLHAPVISEAEQLSLYYEIAYTYERISDPKEALYFYELIRKRDSRYRDVLQRIASIEDRRPPPIR